MPIDFPSNPSSGQTYSYAGQQWQFNGVAWDKTTGSGSGPTGPTGPQGNTGATGAQGEPGQSSNYYSYKVHTTTQTPPTGNGEIRYNNATQTSSTVLYVDHLDNNGDDIDIFLSLLKQNDNLIIQDASNSNNYQTWRINSAPTVILNDYTSIPVTGITSAGTGTSGFANNHQVLFIVFSSPIATAYVESLRGLTGAIGLTNGNGIGISVSGNTLTFSNTGVLSFNGLTGAVTGVSTVNGLTGTVTNVALTTNTLSQFASTTSAELATLISNETGSGSLVFAQSPALVTSLTTSSATFALVNTIATTLNFGGAATTLTIGATSGTASIRNPTLTLGNTTNIIVTNSGTTNYLTLQPYGNINLTPVTSGFGAGSSTTVVVTNDRNAAGQVQISGGDLYLGTKTTNDEDYEPVNIIFEGTSDNTNETILTVVDPTADRTITLPDASGTVALTTGIVSSLSGSTYISVSGSTGAVTITNRGVQTFNGLTGAVIGVTLGGSNIFTALNTFNAGISGNASTATTLQTTRSINETSFNGSSNITINQVYREDNRIISPSEGSTGYSRFSFTTWNNDNSNPYADSIHFRTYQDGSGGNDNLLMLRKDTIGMRLWQQTYGSATPYSNYKDVAFTDNTVASFNGLTGAVTGVTVGGTNVFTALNTFNAGISAAGSTFSSTTNTLDVIASTEGAGLRIAKAVTGANSRVGGIRLGRSGTTTQNTYLEGSAGAFAIYNGVDNTAANLASFSALTFSMGATTANTLSLNCPGTVQIGDVSGVVTLHNQRFSIVGSTRFFTFGDNSGTTAGFVGINRAADGLCGDYSLEVNSPTGKGLQLIYNDHTGAASNWVNMDVSSGGNYTLRPSGGLATVTGTLNVSAGISAAGATLSGLLTTSAGISAAGTTAASFNGLVDMNFNTLYEPTLRYYNEVLASPAITANVLTLDLSTAQMFTVSLNANITTFTITNTPATANRSIGFTLIFTADGTARTVTWGATVKWANNDPPALTSTNGNKDILSFVSPDGGTNWYGFIGGLNF